MQVKFNRSKYVKDGMLSVKSIYRLEARLHLSPEEDALFTKFDIWKMMLKFSVKNFRVTEGSKVDLLGNFKDLHKGLEWESASFGEVLAMEPYIIEAVEGAHAIIAVGETFEGSERVVDIPTAA